ncbi:ArsR/SmtB family transcription factor [Candidatus Laterigemmans baculatus]|uniref:ArsR/SmtB family transcription factor n=1 Tax=Candidatus Laterigemmans baculatus TaxID=2770505 RepID=UPI0013DC8863|nr:metalloregulator ArsR/SmtB family transcription factor [Candidatus Laterigemmans baculatus]
MPIEVLEEAAECLRTVAHPYRLRMIQLLLEGDYMVAELAEACGIQPHMASEHLRLMQRVGLLTSRRDGRKIYYSVAEPHLKDIVRCIEGRYGSK